MLSNILKPSSSLDRVTSHCTLCGLMCDTAADLPNGCARRECWLATLPHRKREFQADDGALERFGRIQLNDRTLIWLDACDVQTTRAAVQLARSIGGTIHVGQSTGAHAVKSVMASDGWFGTTLSEVAARAEMIVTLGDGLSSEAPLLGDRFFRSTTRDTQPYWLHISPHAQGNASQASGEGNRAAPDEYIHWPREQWFERLSQLAMGLLPAMQNVSLAEADLARRLQAVKQSVWMWDVDDLHFQVDELLIRRLLSIARTLNEQARCALLPLELNVGRVTAEETLLWLTGCPTTATWMGDHWYRSPHYSAYSLEQWSDAFSSILLVSTLASDRTLPNLRTSMTLQTQPASQPHEIQVAAVGLDTSGHLFRGDRGAVHFLQATSPSGLPAAASLLTQCRLSRNSAVRA